MSKENLQQFIQKVTDDEQLQSRLGEEIDIDSLIALGAEHGFEFSVDDLQESAELSDEELGGVAGGRGDGTGRSTNPVDMTTVSITTVQDWIARAELIPGMPKAPPDHIKGLGKKIGS